MWIVSNYGLAVLLCVITMFCWGSWGNTQKLASKTWRYEYFYWDYVIGVLIFSLISAFTFGSIGAEGRSFIPDLQQATWNNIGLAFAGGVIFNLSNITRMLEMIHNFLAVHYLFPPVFLMKSSYNGDMERRRATIFSISSTTPSISSCVLS